MLTPRSSRQIVQAMMLNGHEAWNEMTVIFCTNRLDFITDVRLQSDAKKYN